MKVWPFVLLSVVGAHVLAAPSDGGSRPLHDLFAAAWDYDMQQRPDDASELGDRRWNDRWPDKSPQAYAARNQHYQQLLAQLAKIDRSGLNQEDRLNYDLFQKRYAERVEQFKYHWFLMSFNQREGPQTSDNLADALRF